jgi:hypothetical protein
MCKNSQFFDVGSVADGVGYGIAGIPGQVTDVQQLPENAQAGLLTLPDIAMKALCGLFVGQPIG